MEDDRMKAHSPFRVFFFGDSICFGQGISLHKGWVTRISAELNQLGASREREIIVVNVSVSGNTTQQALERMPYDVQSQNPDAVIVQFGMNDCNYWETDKGNPRVSPDAFSANLREIIARSVTFGAQKIFLHTNHPSARNQKTMAHTALTYQQSNRRYNELIRKVAETAGDIVTLTDVEHEFENYIRGDEERLRSLLLPEPDLLHLSEVGHDLYFKSVYPTIERSLLEIL